MRPARVFSWRKQLPPPFDKPIPALRSVKSADDLSIFQESSYVGESCGRSESAGTSQRQIMKRRNSTCGALDQADRRVNWLRFIDGDYRKRRRDTASEVVEKLRRLKNWNSSKENSGRTANTTSFFDDIRRNSFGSQELIQAEPTDNEILALTAECFPRIEESRVVIIEFSENSCRASEFTLEEVLLSEHILQPRDFVNRVRWIYAEYHKIGSFWGSDVRFAQWGTDPAMFEKSPIVLLQKRLAELDRHAGRPPLEAEFIPNYKKIGKYHREVPGCPEYLGLRVNPQTWLSSEPCDLLLDYLSSRPRLSKELQRANQNELGYGLSYIDAIESLQNAAYQARPGLRELHRLADKEKVYNYGCWDDNVERHEFYREHTLLSCGTPRLLKAIANRLLRKEDPLRQNPDCAFLFYTLARVSIENDEMMQDGPERGLNKIFARLKNQHAVVDRKHLELIFNLQRAILEGLDYFEETQRELTIWGIPLGNHRINFHPDHSPPEEICRLIQLEMDIVEKDFETMTGHWRSLKSKVDRHLDVLLQFRVLGQQELAVEQQNMATKQQDMAVKEAKKSVLQNRSIFILTGVTVIFLPLSFFTSYFGMHLSDSTGTDLKSFWEIAGPISVILILLVFSFVRIMSSTELHDEEKAMDPTEEARVQMSWRSCWNLRYRKSKQL